MCTLQSAPQRVEGGPLGPGLMGHGPLLGPLDSRVVLILSLNLLSLYVGPGARPGG